MPDPAGSERENLEARILVVDDERANVVILERVLERGGYQNVRSTTDSRAAIDILDDWLPDLILLDLSMPPPDGFAILTILSRRPESDRVPVLVLTASAMPDVKQRAFGLGASDFVEKPFDHAEVRLRIRNLLATRALERELRDQNEVLEQRVVARTAELTASLTELRQAIDQRDALMSRLITAQEEERRRIASDIHDDTVQAMVAAAMQIERLQRAPVTQARLAGELENLMASVRDATARLRNLLFDVHPATLEHEGLAGSLDIYLERMRAAGGPAYTLHVEDGADASAEMRATLYRIAQEALTNVRKHGRASRIDVRLTVDSHVVTMRISDDGVGFQAGTAERADEGHLGITTMRERAAVAGGTLRIESARGRGTTVEIQLPLLREGNSPAPSASAAGVEAHVA